MAEEEKKVNYSQAPEIEKEKSRLIQLVQDDKMRRDAETTFFRNETLATYSEVALGQFIGHRTKPEWKKDYQYNVFDHITRDKVMAILSKSAGLYQAQFFNTNKRHDAVGDIVATVLGAFYEDSTRRLNEKEKNKMIMLDALTQPKTIWYEGWRHQKRTIREIDERDKFGRISKTTEKKIVHYNGPWGEVVNVLDIVPGSLRIRDLQEQPRFTWIPKMSMHEFRRRYPISKYPEAAKVTAHGEMFDNDELSQLIVRDDLKEDEVEVAHIFEKWEDRLTIIANGIMITPKDSPMPFAHKDYPFVWGGFEAFSPHFIYDMPLTMKILDMQDMNNEILNLSLDMVWRALNEVTLVKNGDDINEDELFGGGMIEVDDPNNFNKLDFGSSLALNGAANMREVARRSIESASLDAPSSGQAGAGRITAREALIAREAAMEITTLFLDNMEEMEKGKALLRAKNQLDRYRRPIDWEKRLGKDMSEEAIPVFREISVRDATMTDGKKGIVNINITENPRSRAQLDSENVVNNKQRSQGIDISPQFIRDIQFDVEIISGSIQKKSRAVRVGEARAFLNDAATMPDIIDVPAAAEDYVKSLGKKPDEALVQKDTSPEAQLMKKFGGGQNLRNPSQAPAKPAEEFAPDSIEGILNKQL